MVTSGYQGQVTSQPAQRIKEGVSPNEQQGARRGRQDGSSVGSEGDMSATLSPGSGSSGQRDQHNNNHNSNEV